MRRKWDTESGKPPYHDHPFCAWLRGLTKKPAQFAKFQETYSVPLSTAYKWASGECLPSGKYHGVYSAFYGRDGGGLLC